MAKRDPQPTGSSRSRQRGKPVQVQPKKPWGFIAGSLVLGLLLVGVLAYAALNSGSGFEDPLERADRQVEGVAVSDEELGRNHVATPVTYPQTPPVGGDHAAQWQNCNGDVYAEPINNENAVHSLEHGAVWVTYKPGLPEAQLEQLREAVQGESYTLLSPVPEQTAPINVTAWGRRLTVEQASDPRIEDFINTYANGPQTPERGATCGGGVATTRADTTTTTTPATGAPASGAPATGAPAPQASVAVPVG